MSNITPEVDPWVIIAEQRTLIAELKATIAELRAEIAQLKAENADLRAKLNTNSTNSSLPPSQDFRRSKRTQKPSGKKRGGQIGHPGHARKLFSSKEITKTVDVHPDVCPHCEGSSFDIASASIECRQVVELPEIQPEVTQYNIHTCRCGKCGKHVRARVPAEAVKGYGPRLMGFVTTLMGDSGMSKRKISALTGYLGIKISIGGVCNIHKLASEVLKEPYNNIRQEVLSQNSVNGDETSWRCRGKKCWVWVVATAQATFFKIDLSRSQEAFSRVFGGFNCTLTSDRYGAYNIHTGGKQVCLAHIKRDWMKVSERDGLEGWLGRELVKKLGHVFEVWHEFKRGESSRIELQQRAKEQIEDIRVLLKGGTALEGMGNKTQGLCYDLLGRFESLWRFLYEGGVEPTNNLAERALRPMVIWRKLSCGTQSEWGNHLNERLQTVVFTLKQRMQNVFEYLTCRFQECIRAGPASVSS